ncbi:MAG: aminoglycoside phosphotransferase family protein [Lentisphaerae bacterium]|nr:aminoglycoside phosphotransferase family protein [Lentisphaerota bacterium]
MQYLGHLPESDPLFSYLKNEIFPQINCDCRDGIRVFRTNGSNAVYIYEERTACNKVVGKFFYSERQRDKAAALRRLEREYRNTMEFRSYLDGFHYAARVLGCKPELDCLLVVEYCYGEPLDDIILRSINNNDPQLLYNKLKALAWFLANLHNRSARPAEKVRFSAVCHYFELVVNGLQGVISPGDDSLMRSLCRQWHDQPFMWEDCEVLVHGDATPSNFFFGDDMHVITFDLERVQRTDRIFDVGRIAAELQHFFMRTTGNKYAAEPFIGHFLWEYSCHFPDREQTFKSISRRIPFYMGVNLLRIARNSYLDYEYRQKLISEAGECLRSRQS